MEAFKWLWVKVLPEKTELFSLFVNFFLIDFKMMDW